MWQFFSPLKIFIMGMVCTLLATIFFPGINTASTQAASDISGYASHYWALSAILTSTRLVIFIMCFMITLFLTGLAWYKRKS
jgi:hypothetical protein